ncbi:hypothetical protein RCO28_12715 [Streptomyces sp. LHD-70]|uniref:hypothetical protein n=1 Tax=Streptomyces sp. LHD-70 TaxID=3072140 RepID=UPI00280E0788|nr:hypothetical protein [Streptomyces sp. LHD-70]MDQ8703343.1 hypothetical protein [Streptomyces sp. LHD-70]
MTTHTLDTVTALLHNLSDETESGRRIPTAPELTCAEYVLQASGEPTEVICDALRLAGPDVAPKGSTFAVTLVHCAGLLRSASAAESPDGQALIALLHRTMSTVANAPRQHS